MDIDTDKRSTCQPAVGSSGKYMPAPRFWLERRLGRVLLTAAIFLGLLASPWLGSQNGLAAVSSTLNPLAAIPVQSGLPAGMELTGHLVPNQWLNLGFTSGGEVDQILVKEGDRVQAGQPLAQFGNLESYAARTAAAEFELTQAQLALKNLNEQATQNLALAEQSLAQANKARAAADSKLRSLQKLPDPFAVAQAYANMLLAQNKVDQIKSDLHKAEKLWNDENNIIWRFVKRHDFKLNLMNMERQLSLAEVRYQAAINAYHDRQKPADPIDLAQAEADLAIAQAQVSKSRLDRDRLKNGPDPDQVALLQARIQAAQSNLKAAQASYAATSLSSPISGTVVAVKLKPGEWAQPGQTVMVVADLSRWRVECNELTEDQVLALQAGQTLQVSLDALPQAALQGTLTSIGDTYQMVHGDVRFSAKIDLNASLPDMRWGMTARLH